MLCSLCQKNRKSATFLFLLTYNSSTYGKAK
nr:MAG TPA: hypothetical protein [Caudoviricetes sp.]